MVPIKSNERMVSALQEAVCLMCNVHLSPSEALLDDGLVFFAVPPSIIPRGTATAAAAKSVIINPASTLA